MSLSIEQMPTHAVPYLEFIARKQQLDGASGFEPVWMPDFLKDFQRHLVTWGIRKGRAAVLADCGLGKGLRPDCPVLTPDGFRPLADLKEGNQVIGSDGKPTAITGVYYRGVQSSWRVTFSDANSIICDDDHLWNVKSYNDVARNNPWRTMATKDLAETQLKYGTHGQSRTWQIPLVTAVQHPTKTLPVDPYLLGVLLGDGLISSGNIQWCKPDSEIADRIRQTLPAGLTLNRLDKGSSTTQWSITTPRGYANPLLDAVRSLGLIGKRAWEKFVPAEYLTADVETRIALLQGLMDTDGYAGESPEFCSTSHDLAAAVVRLVESLGGIASFATKDAPAYSYQGESRIGRTAYRVVFTLPPDIRPFSLPRKAEAYKPASRGLGRWIDSIERVADGETICIKVDAPDGLFVIDHYIVTHNTPMQLVVAENIVRKTNRPYLIATPLAVSHQLIREGEKFGIECKRSTDGTIAGKITVTNIERLHHFNRHDFAGMGLDESSILKGVDGATRTFVTEFMREMEYRHLWTATAAPNDYFELGTSSEALGYLGYQDMLTRFFKEDSVKDYLGWGRKTYRFRGHAEQQFWRWVCSWARVCRRPSDLGFDDAEFILPGLVEQEHVIRNSAPREGMMFAIPANDLREQREERRVTLDQRCEVAASYAIKHPGASVLWCHLNDEGDLLEKLIPDCVQVSGSMSDDEKEEKLIAFQDGKIPRLVTKPKIGCFGLNWQHCHNVITFPSHSFEQYYQAIHRCLRFGQKNVVTTTIVTTEGEIGVLKNLQRKMAQADRMFESLSQHTNDALKIDRSIEFTKQANVPAWLRAS